MSAQEHIEESRRQLAWALRALEFEDLEGAAGRAWEAAVEATKAVAETRNLACTSSADVYGIAYALMDDSGDEKMADGFSWASTLHTESLRATFEERDITMGIMGATDFVERVAACLDV